MEGLTPGPELENSQGQKETWPRGRNGDTAPASATPKRDQSPTRTLSPAPLRSVHRRIHDEVFRRFVRCEFFDHSALAADQYSVGHSHDLRQVGRDDHHRFAPICEAIDNFVDFRNRANIYATSRLVEDDDLRLLS